MHNITKPIKHIQIEENQDKRKSEIRKSEEMKKGGRLCIGDKVDESVRLG